MRMLTHKHGSMKQTGGCHRIFQIYLLLGININLWCLNDGSHLPVVFECRYVIGRIQLEKDWDISPTNHESAYKWTKWGIMIMAHQTGMATGSTMLVSLQSQHITVVLRVNLTYFPSTRRTGHTEYHFWGIGTWTCILVTEINMAR